ncbi:MAG: hypothetical protein FWH36_08695 [Lentimicrobiaceae bacterium]|nr:hypothetical protein [Lentimicrobiaceae bacterium]
MKNIVIKTGLLLFVVVSFCGCELVNMLNCTFERKNIDNFRFAGVSFDKFNSINDINLVDIAQITLALAEKTAPITFNMYVEGKNPNKSAAAIEEFKWIFLLDNNEVLNGNTFNKFSIPAKGTNILPLEIGFDAMNYLDGSTPESLFRFYQNITGKNSSGESNATLKIKPTINGIEFPQYITLNQTVN